MAYNHRRDLLEPFFKLDQGANRVQAEYVWIDGVGELRSKTTTVLKLVKGLTDLRIWDVDGWRTGQAPEDSSDIYLRPAAIFKDPFRGGNNVLALAETFSNDGTPNMTNYRHHAVKVMDNAKESKPWFGIEQQYTLLDSNDRPLGWPTTGVPDKPGSYYCGVGGGKVVARDVAEAHYRACLYAGINISGTNAQLVPSQWEFQIGPCEGVEMGDHLWMARYILIRTAEMWGLKVSFDPKALEGQTEQSTCHSNFSTVQMREKGGIKYIEEAISKLERRHPQHLEAYGGGRGPRTSGEQPEEAASEQEGNTFSFGIAKRDVSVRIPRHVAAQGFGYLEDRRPASNVDPYRVTSALVETILANPQ